MEFATGREDKVLVMRKLYAGIITDVGDEPCYTIIPTSVLEDYDLQFALRIHHIECSVANGKRYLLVVFVEINIRVTAYLCFNACNILVHAELNFQHRCILRQIIILVKNLQAIVAA